MFWEEVAEDYLKFTRKGTRFKCKLCTKCCSLERIFITIYDLKKIYKAAPEYIFKIVSFFSDYYEREILTPIKEPKKRMKCSFLEDNKCVLHGVAKPLACQRYPFTFILEETVKERGLTPPEDALKVIIYFMETEIRGYIMHAKICPGVNNDEGEEVDGEEIAKATIKNSLEHLKTKNQDPKGLLRKLKHKTKRRLEFLDNFVKTATLTKIEIPLPGSSTFIGGFIAFNKEVLGENYFALISCIATQLNQELST
ncbi:MAG: YkgJ family cysteine cluster protein, partial [Candidatus Hodarchaeota archaeon]